MVLGGGPFYGRGMTRALRFGLVCFSLPLVCVLVFGANRSANASPLPRYRGSAAEAVAAKAGWRTSKVLRVDLTGDGRRDYVVVLTGARGLRLVALSYVRGDAERRADAFRTEYEEQFAAATRVVRLESDFIAGDPSADLVAVVEAPSPDERAISARIVGRHRGRMKAFWKKSYLITSTEAAAAGGARIALGDASPHFELEDRDRDGGKEIIWTLGPQIIEVRGRAGPVEFVVGARQTVLRFDAEQGVYRSAQPDRADEVDEGESTVDFLPPHSPSEVEATQQVPKIWGTAQAFWGADGDLETAWTVRGVSAVGQALTLRFSERPKVSLIRVVPGCGAGKDDWQRYVPLERFVIQLSTGLRFELQADGGGPWPNGVRGIGVFPLGGNFGRQILIFLEDPKQVAWGRLEVQSLGRRKRRSKGRIDEVCVSEVSFH